MNVFYIDKDPVECARQHCDKHVVKMIIEYAQLLSTAHRVLDGEEYEGRTQSGRKARRFRLPDDRENYMYMASHLKHPDEIWIQQSHSNYLWVSQLFHALCDEYTHRYGKIHETHRKLYGKLSRLPENIPSGFMTEPPQCMPDYCKSERSIDAYHKYYIKEKARFAKWTKRQIPEWFKNAFI